MSIPISNTFPSNPVFPSSQLFETTRHISANGNVLPPKLRIVNEALRDLSAARQRKGKIRKVAGVCHWSTEETGDIVADLALAAMAAYTVLRLTLKNSADYCVAEADKTFKELIEDKAALLLVELAIPTGMLAGAFGALLI